MPSPNFLIKMHLEIKFRIFKWNSQVIVCLDIRSWPMFHGARNLYNLGAREGHFLKKKKYKITNSKLGRKVSFFYFSMWKRSQQITRILGRAESISYSISLGHWPDMLTEMFADCKLASSFPPQSSYKWEALSWIFTGFMVNCFWVLWDKTLHISACVYTEISWTTITLILLGEAAG